MLTSPVRAADWRGGATGNSPRGSVLPRAVSPARTAGAARPLQPLSTSPLLNLPSVPGKRAPQYEQTVSITVNDHHSELRQQ